MFKVFGLNNMNNTVKDNFSQLREDFSEVEQKRFEREVIAKELQELKDDNAILFNSVAEKLFIENLCKLISEFKCRLYERDAINESAYRLNISPVTAKRYLAKHTTRLAQFYIEDGRVHCRHHNHEPAYKIVKKH